MERQLDRGSREPRPDEIAEELEDLEEVREILSMAQLPVSLEKPTVRRRIVARRLRPGRQAEAPFTASLSLRSEDIELALRPCRPGAEGDRDPLRLAERTLQAEEDRRAFGVTRESLRRSRTHAKKTKAHRGAITQGTRLGKAKWGRGVETAPRGVLSA